MFCFLAFFSCEREDAFPDTHGPAEPIDSTEPVDAGSKSASILAGAIVEINLLSAHLTVDAEAPASISEDDLKAAASAAGVDFRAVSAQIQDGFNLMSERNEDSRYVGAQIIETLRNGGLINVEKLPCLEQYERDMMSAAAHTLECVSVLAETGPGITACVVGFVALASIADNDFDRCLKETYPKG